ncbi:cation:proton antiporter [Streptosporangium saharense]|uniref:Kef-type K+ transport system membrane component KefB n=1 Tax=Streptosporangium saharense TaxID=1706840 RepID=A0A7W7QLL8_9ACTN|nr:cation:proton antiporter [Streptosporangium saharense]MBB4915664.1 Kef-type K+ transport system membrane component KefB [Streptosporangium saharense]
MGFPSLQADAVLLMWVQLLVIVLAGRLLGAAARRIGQPGVVGELLAGVLLGPSILGWLWPAAAAVVIPDDRLAAAPLNTVAWLGVALLLVLTGLETDLATVRRLGRASTLIAVGALGLPFAAGIGLGTLMPESFHGSGANRTAFVLFIAIALSISSLPVIARILTELGLIRSDAGQVIIAVAMTNDLAGWAALGLVTALAGAGTLSVGMVATLLGGVVLLLVVALTVGQRLTDAALRAVRDRGAEHGGLVVAVVATGVFAALAHLVGSDAVIGAYLAGLLLGRSRFFPAQLRNQIEPITVTILAPVFFATAGLRLDLTALASTEALLWAGAVLACAVLTKVIGALGGARLARLGTRDGLMIAAGLNARGAVEVVIATVGLQAGVLSTTAYTAIVLMALVTTVMAPPVLRALRPARNPDPVEVPA